MTDLYATVRYEVLKAYPNDDPEPLTVAMLSAVNRALSDDEIFVLDVAGDTEDEARYREDAASQMLEYGILVPLFPESSE